VLYYIVYKLFVPQKYKYCCIQPIFFLKKQFYAQHFYYYLSAKVIFFSDKPTQQYVKVWTGESFCRKSLRYREKFVSLQAERVIKNNLIMVQNNFKTYNSPEQYAAAFQQMIDARERWREQIKKQETSKAK
jgi:hypothetical protein